MSEEYLKQLMIDAARYRWLRENVFDIEAGYFYQDETPEEIDAIVDENRE